MAVVTDSRVIFQRYDTLPTFKSCRRWPGNPNGRSKFRNLRLFTLARSQLTLRQRLRGFLWLSEIAQMARCWRQAHRWRLPDNPNGRTKFCNLRLFTLARSQLTLWRRPTADGSFWRLFLNIENITGIGPAMTRISSKFRSYENWCVRGQAKALEKHLFAVMTSLWWHCVLFFFYYHSQLLLFSPTKNNISMILTPT